MSKYYYKAKDKRGEIIFGEINAPNLWKAKKSLNDSHLLVLELKQFNLKGFYQALNSRLESETAVISPDDIEIALGQIEAGYSVGMPLTQIIEFVHNDQKNRFLKNILFEINEDIKQGKSLHEAFGKHSKIFNPTVVGLLKMGESTGKTGETLKQINKTLTLQNETRIHLNNATFYPKIVLMMTLYTMMFLFYFVVPKIKKSFSKKNMELPALTKFVFDTSDFIVHFWFLILPVIIGGYFLLKKYAASPAGKTLLDPLILKIPRLGEILKFYELNQFCLLLNLQLKSGLNMMESLENLKDSLSNSAFKKAMSDCQKEILQGGTLTKGLEKSGLFPLSFKGMIAMSEEVGRLQPALEKLSARYQVEIKYKIEKFSKLVEPVMFIFVGAVVLIAALSILMAIQNMTKIVTPEIMKKSVNSQVIDKFNQNP